MPFTMPCNNSGCYKVMEPYLDTQNDKVYCSECDKEINNVTHFTKVQMKTLKQFKPKRKVSFSVKCLNCQKEARPLLIQDKIVCPGCQQAHSNLSEQFKIILKEQLKKVDQDV